MKCIDFFFDKLRKVFEVYFIKKRYIIFYQKTQIHCDVNSEKLVSHIKMIDFIDMGKYSSYGNLINYINIRKNDKSWILFSLNDRENIKGFGFLHIPSKIEWNDSLPTLPGEARISSNFVYPEYRGKGVRGVIANYQIKYINGRYKLWSVVEASNISSLNSELKIGEIKRVNYLVKFIGKNILSILTNPFRVYVLIGKRRASR